MTQEAGVPLMDLAADYRLVQPDIDEAVSQVLAAGQFILGPNVRALEGEIATYLDIPFGVGVASGTDALVLGLRALDIGPGDEVIVPAYTFYATAEAVMMVGATPVLAEVEPETFCIDAEDAARRISPRTRAIIPVHLYGHPADMSSVLRVAEAHGLKVLEDNAQAFGAAYRGRKTGSIGDVGCLSFFPSKNLGACGDGGMVVARDEAVAARVRMLRTHGWKRKYEPEMVGYNSRLDELQAAILRVKLRHIDEWNDRRRRVADLYRSRLQGSGVVLPYEAPEAHHVYHVYVVRVPDRPAVERALSERKIGSSVYYPLPLHLIEPLRPLGYHQGDFPVSERASRETLAIPLFPTMTEEQVDTVVKTLSGARLILAGRSSS